MTVESDPAQRALWDIEEDDYGEPMIFHVHTLARVPAHVISRFESSALAQCSECMAYLSLSGTGAAEIR